MPSPVATEPLLRLIAAVNDQESLLDLLGSPVADGGLGWPIHPDRDLATYPELQIAQGLKGDVRADVSTIVQTDGGPRVLLVEFERPYLRRDLRGLLDSVRRQRRASGRPIGEETVFVAVAPNRDGAPYADVRFVLFRAREGRSPEIRSFGWDDRLHPGHTVVTVNLPALRRREDLAGAWDVEALTERFYKVYDEEVFRPFRDEIRQNGRETRPPEEEAHVWAQVMFNRFLFLAFVQRMGWLVGPDGSRKEYLQTLYARFKAGERGGFADFCGVLDALFLALDTEDETERRRHAAVIGEVEYLNGGLFAKSEEAVTTLALTVPDTAFERILGPGGLFARFNFTVTESTPLDQEVAVDPEMLGKIFERLVNDRHAEGKYYTPRPIVSFMVDEAVKGYLIERGVDPAKAALLVDEGGLENDAGLVITAKEVPDLRKFLSKVRAVDPACGSGAYLLGLLQKLFQVRDLLELRAEEEAPEANRDRYATKLSILRQSIYGLDLDETAVRIARLRLWLSLVIENRLDLRPDGSISPPQPLPNLDLLVECGDALAVPLETSVLSTETIVAYGVAKQKYSGSGGAKREALTREITDLRQKIVEAFGLDLPKERPDHPTLAAAYDEKAAKIAKRRPLAALSRRPFDWSVEFADVLSTGGFDIVLANPPYVSGGNLLRSVGEKYKRALIAAYPEVSTGDADLLLYFFARAFQLLRPGGQLVFVTSNKWLKTEYGEKARRHFATQMRPSVLLDFHHLPVFQGIMAYPLITLATKGRKTGTTRFLKVPSLQSPYPDVGALVEEGDDLPETAVGADGVWLLANGEMGRRLTRMREKGTPFGEYVGGKIYRGILTGLNDVLVAPDGRIYSKGEKAPPGSQREGVFVIDDAKRNELLAQDSKSAEIIRPLVIGRDIHRWYVENNSRWLIVTKIGTDMSRYPAVMAHLGRFESKLRPRADQGEHWWELRSCTYYAAYDSQQVVWGNLSTRPTFGISSAGEFLIAPSVSFEIKEPWLLGFLNSRAAEDYLAEIAYSRAGGYFEMKPVFVKRLPVPPALDEDKAAIEAIVHQILTAKQADPAADVTALEAEIDERVEFLYFGDAAERSFDAVRAQAAAEIRMLARGGETEGVEFKETLHLNLRSGLKDREMLHEALRAIGAFLNRDGGTLLIGVHDDGAIPGIDRDLPFVDRKGLDGWRRSLLDGIRTAIAPYPAELVSVRTIEVDGVPVGRIEVTGDPTHHFTVQGATYVRQSGQSAELRGADVTAWWDRRRTVRTEAP